LSELGPDPVNVGRPSPGREASALLPVAMSASVVAISALPAFLTGALAVEMRSEFELPPSTLGLLVGLFFACSALTSAPAGRLVERVGARSGFRIAACGAALSMAGIALLARSPLGIAGMLAVGGASNALAHPSANLLLVHSTPARRRGLVLGIKQAAIPGATLLAGLSLPAIALTLGWRQAFAGAAVLALAIAVTGAAVASRWESGSRSEERVAEALPRPDRGLLLLAGAATLGIWGGQAMGGFLVSYGVSAGFDKATAAMILALGSVAGITARVIAGHIVDLRASAGLVELATMLLIGAVGLVLVASGTPALLWIGPIATFAGGWGWTGILNYAAIRAYPGSPAAATGVVQIGVYVGATLGVPLFGLIVEATSYPVAWGVTAIAAAASAGLMLLARTMIKPVP
jgi:predicted MFS family arabinose efflux permease